MRNIGHLGKNNFPVNNDSSPRIIVDQVMQFFGASTFWSSSALSPESVVFVSKSHRIDHRDLDEINKTGMSFIALSPAIAHGLDLPLYIPDSKNGLNFQEQESNKKVSWENQIITKYTKDFVKEKNYWKDFFSMAGAKIYVSHHKWSADPIPAFAAMKELGGISVLFQTSYYEFPEPDTAVFADVYFPFSSKVAESEQKNGSGIKYLIGIGYIFDHKFQLLKSPAKVIKKKLRNRGAKKIISYFDSGSSDDERWGAGGTNYRRDYQFWLEKVLEEPWFGLIIKSKKPGTLKSRLGNTVGLLNEAIQTGRCYFNEESDYSGGKNLKSRPAEAALASDIAIHQCLYAGSAGLEAALAGIPTLLFDRYGMKHSQLYKLGVGKVVFTDRSVMWDALREHWDKEPIPGFGDWSPIIDDLDPFRDGKAAYRMTTYLHWLLEGFKQGVERETILADVAERYANEWGDDKAVCMS